MADSSGIVQELQDKIDYAKALHVEETKRMAEWEQLYKGEYLLPKDIADTDATLYKSAKPRAIVHKALSMLKLRAREQIQVLPRSDATSEEALCTRLEQYLEGYQMMQRRQTSRSAFRDNVEWGLLRGKAVLIAQYIPRFVGTEFFPLRTVAPDPLTVFEVEGEGGIMYYVRETERYVMELSREIQKRIDWDEYTGEDSSRWRMPGKMGEKKSTAKVKLVEYMDGEYYAALVDDDLVLPPKEHGYGFCNIAIARVNPTPFQEYEWRGRSILADPMDALKDEAILMSKMSDAVSTFFWPDIMAETPTGLPIVFNSKSPGSVTSVPPGSKITVLNASPNIPILQQYWQMLQSDINIATFPEIAWGLDTSIDGGQSGFAISQVLGQVMDRLQDMKEEFEIQHATHFGQILRLTEKFSDRKEAGGGFQVLVTAQGKKVKTRGLVVRIGPADVAGHVDVVCRITPTLPTEKMAMMQQMGILRQRDPKTGRPLADDKSIREMYPEVFERPDEINQRVDEEVYEQSEPEIQQWNRDEFMERWRKDHPKRPEKNLGEISRLSKAELQQRLAMLQMMLQDPQAFVQALTAMGSGGAPTPGPAETSPSQAPPAGGPPPVAPSILPPVMAGAAGTNPIVQGADQMAGAMTPPR